MKRSKHLLAFTKFVCSSVIAAAMAITPAQAQQAYPNKLVKLLVGFAAGGPTDNAARVVAEALAKQLGQPVIVENRPGANSQIAAMELVRSKPDGYTLLLASNGTLTIAPAIYKRLPYDVSKDFTLVGSVVGYPHVLVVPGQSKATDLASLIKLAKSSPQGLNSASVGHVNDLTIEWFQKLAGITLTRVPYKGDSAVISDLVSRRIDMAFLAPNVAIPLMDGKKLHAVGLTTDVTVERLKAIPPLKDAGLQGFDMKIWNGIVAPAGTDPAIVKQLNTALKSVLQTPEVQTKLAQTGQQVIIDTPEEFGRNIEQESVQWKRIVKDANLQLIE
ncbi:Bug family tripartite tricarboxylate transporter substrate binding protein [Noviherbaspirillum sp. Root189]|uniref:Bug family tripartite tricarboxylate transporter substrate binding protein n=1 Tax=Noviherbaspirillum sp. Root189 TaxID=1736487 RepID=UPI00070D43D2|nr:tripartite tricarboxylate transporter substrate binding protein [Noviherbaspirillum sp. Root189]KRB75742.1 hypothetical protein ASE07_26390 [Noviherbaspirillum sp. Root189]